MTETSTDVVTNWLQYGRYLGDIITIKHLIIYQLLTKN